MSDQYAALNDFCDAAEALPTCVIRYITSLFEVDAKSLHQLLHSSQKPQEEVGHVIERIRENVVANIPWADQKDAIVSVAADEVEHVSCRLQNDSKEAARVCFPEEIVYGSLNHPALTQALSSENYGKIVTGTRGAESRRRETKINTSQGTPTKKKRGQQLGYNGNQRSPRSWQNLPSIPQWQVYGKNTTEEFTRKLLQEDTTIYDEGTSEDVYCYCRQISYGRMIGCDGENCPREWFHLECIGLTEPPKGEWYCRECIQQRGFQQPKTKKKRALKR